MTENLQDKIYIDDTGQKIRYIPVYLEEDQEVPVMKVAEIVCTTMVYKQKGWDLPEIIELPLYIKGKKINEEHMVVKPTP